ncbi:MULTISPECIES: hypothetical protein [unclassified Streptomyces]|uniref:hypothetical protein n=1 Tax=unclassified Streptomyces TaxID=2593676 RepID=UPI0037FBF647
MSDPSATVRPAGPAPPGGPAGRTDRGQAPDDRAFGARLMTPLPLGCRTGDTPRIPGGTTSP